MKLHLAFRALTPVAVAAMLTLCLNASTRPTRAAPIELPSPASAFIVAHLPNDAKRFRVSGRVESVNYADNSVEIFAAGRLFEIQITPTTAIEIHGEAGSIADVRGGQKVTASGIMRNGAWVAHSLTIR